jgi:type I restriction enzyme S subunit
MTKQWAHKSLQDLLILNRSGFWGEEAPSKARPIQVKVIRNADLTKHNSIKGSATRYFSAKEAANAELQIGDIAMSSSGDVGKAWLTNEPGYSASNFIRILRPDANYIVPGFLRYVLESDQGQAALKASTAGTTIQNLQKTFYSMLTVPLPPLAEQQRIVRLLDEAFEGIAIAKANAEQNLKNAHTLFESYLHNIFLEGGNEWQMKKIREVCEAVNVGHVGPSSMHRDPKGIPFLMGKNIGFGIINEHNIERIKKSFHREQKKSQLRSGDIVVVRIGKSGQAAKIPASFGEANCSGLVVIKQPCGVDADYLVYYLNSPAGRRYSLSQAKGSTRQTLNTSTISSTLVPVPPLAEQRRIVDRVSAFEESTSHLVTVSRKKIRALEDLRVSLISQAFSGQLNVA